MSVNSAVENGAAGTILVGVDGTESGRAALRWATRYATSHGADIELLRVVDDEWTTISARMMSELDSDAEGLLEREADYARSLAPDIAVRTRVLHGDVIEELTAASTDARLVVVGTHKTGFINGRVFGSRSLRLASLAHAPVAVIPQGSPRTGRGVVAGVDGSPASQRAVRLATQEAELSTETLTLLRAYTTPELPTTDEDLQSAVIKHGEAVAAATLADAVAVAGSTAPAADVKVRTVRRPAAEALVDAAATAALLVIGDSGADSAEDAMIGSVSHDVLMNLTAPTIVVHAGDDW
ncbi:universal stress protein [Parafrigoribacterium soli]|uniref:universal stress protein n=1 Tax=Parafrigoribacterium soli TaxID=3144663 RepID=UPI0032ED74B1